MNDVTYTAAVVIIGNEILSGRIQDTNLADISIALSGCGIQTAEARVIPDLEDVIVSVVNDLRARYDYVLTTGGLGPTHDDITAASIAKAFGVDLIEHPEITEIIRRREVPAEVMAARLRMCMVPRGANLIENSTGGLPGFYIENVYVMAGMPRAMRAMLNTLQPMLTGGPVLQSRSLTTYLPESTIAVALGALQAAHQEVDIGSYPFEKDGRYGTTLVARGTDDVVLDRVLEKLSDIVAKAGEKPSN